MKLRNLPRGQRVSILERKAVAPTGKSATPTSSSSASARGRGKPCCSEARLRKPSDHSSRRARDSLQLPRPETRSRTKEWFDKLPLDEAMRCADSYFEARNKLRREMFNIRVDLCDECGLVFPPDDLTQIRKSDDRPLFGMLRLLGFR
jgi:hypothetical protein